MRIGRGSDPKLGIYIVLHEQKDSAISSSRRAVLCCYKKQAFPITQNMIFALTAGIQDLEGECFAPILSLVNDIIHAQS